MFCFWGGVKYVGNVATVLAGKRVDSHLLLRGAVREKGAGQTTTNYNYDDTNWLCFSVCGCCFLFCLEVGFILFYLIFFLVFLTTQNVRILRQDTWHVGLVIVSLAFGWLSIHLNIFPAHPKANKNKIVKNHKV